MSLGGRVVALAQRSFLPRGQACLGRRSGQGVDGLDEHCLVAHAIALEWRANFEGSAGKLSTRSTAKCRNTRGPAVKLVSGVRWDTSEGK